MKKDILLNHPLLLFPLMKVKSVEQLHNREVSLPSFSLDENSRKITLAYETYSEALLRYCYSKISDKEKASDLTQETFVRTWQYLMKGNSIQNDKSFLYTTLRHLIIDDYRKKKCISLDTLISKGLEPASHPEENLFTTIETTRVMKYVDQLPARYSSIIIMRYVKDLSVQDIARIINTSENVVSVRIHRGLHKLRVLMPL